MKKPVTATQIALIIWLPVVVIAIVWFTVTEFHRSERAANARNVESAKAVVETENARRMLRHNLDQLNSLVDESEGANSRPSSR